MKTIYTCLWELPEDIRKLAVDHAISVTDVNIPCPHLLRALLSFKWSNTPEGYDHWDNIYEQCKRDLNG